MSKINLYSAKTKTVGSFTLPKDFAGEINMPLINQAIHVYRDRMHAGNSKVKTRAEVDLTKAKWFKQKGTGRARHGAQSAPIFVGGGVAHGPKGVKRVLELPKKMRRKALLSALALKLKENKVVAAKDLGTVSKSKVVQELIGSIAKGEKDEKSKVTFVVSDKNRGLNIFVKNVERVAVEEYSNLNAHKVHFGGRLVLDADIFEQPSRKASAGKKRRTK